MILGGVDLHLHSSASDGSLTPVELVHEAAARKVGLIGITDHDTMDAVGEAVAAGYEVGVTVIPGVELAADSDVHDIHILGYYLRWEDEALQSSLAHLRAQRNARNALILEKLSALRLPLDPARVKEIGGDGSVGRPHIAAAMVEAGFVASQGEAFWRYLGRGKPAFVPRFRLQPADACRIIQAAGGFGVLAHAAKIGSWEVIRGAVADGVAGLEVYHRDHSAAETESLLNFARERSLLVTGGTDSHGPRSDRPTAVGEVKIPAWVGEEFLAHAPAWWRERFTP